VVYTNGAFKVEKNDAGVSMGLVGYPPQMSFWENNGELWLSGSRVLINGTDILSELSRLEAKIPSNNDKEE